MTDDADGHQPRTLADKLNHLYAAARPAGRKPFTDREVAAAINDRGGADISASYLNMLRTGRKTNPTMRHLEALAGFFGVPAAYFFDDAATAQVNEELRRLAQLREVKEALESPEVAALAVKARGLSPGGLQQLAGIIDHVRRLEQDAARERGDRFRTAGDNPST